MGVVAHGLAEWEIDLRTAADTVVEQAKKVVGQGCLNIKKDAQRIIRASSPHGYLPHYPRAIGYDRVKLVGDAVVGEVGPDKDKMQGGLGPYIELGTIHNAPVPHLSPALDAEEPKFQQAVADLGAKLLEGEKIPDGPVVDPE